MPRGPTRARPTPRRLRTVSICCRTSRKPWSPSSPPMTAPCRPSMPRCVSSRCPCLTARSPSRCPRRPPPAEEARAAQRAVRRQARYNEAWALHRQGWSTAAIAAQVGCSRRTIERSLQMPTWPVPQHRRHYGRSILNPYQAYILERWNAGCHTAIQLFQEIQPRGYTGSYRRVTAYVSRIRQAQGIPPRRQGRRQRLPVVAEPVSQPLTPRRATWLVLRREAQRTEAEAQQLAPLREQQAEVTEAIDLAQEFTQLV